MARTLLTLFMHRFLRYGLAACSFMGGTFHHELLADTLQINEWSTTRDGSLRDEDGEATDWIELWNYGPEDISLERYHLSDELEAPDRWTFPQLTLKAGAYLVVMASGKDRRDPSQNLHTNFQLNQRSEAILLSRPGQTGLFVVSVIDGYPDQRDGYSYGRITNAVTESFGFFPSPSPGEANPLSYLEGFVADTRFSVDRGFYREAFVCTVTTQTPGATLVYTTDGTLPGARNGVAFQAASPESAPELKLEIGTTTTLRVMAMKKNMEPSNIDTQTYVFPDDILAQDGEGAPYAQSMRWGHAGPDWAMDPKITQHADPEIRPEITDFYRLPSLSIVMDFEDMFGNGGIYIAGQSVEKPISMEWINPHTDVNLPNEVPGFQTDGTVQIVGGSSPNRWKSDKLSMRLKFDRDLKYPIFGEEAATRFDTLVVDARLNNVWHYGGGSQPVAQRDRAQYVRDLYAANLHNAMGGLSPHGAHAHVFINGIYWGIHTLHERPDDNFAASYFGGENEEYDVIKHRTSTVVQGSNRSYLALMRLADQDLTQADHWASMQSLLEIDDFIDYMLMNYYIGNGDWAHHNWYASYRRDDPNGRWRYHSWDAEKGLQSVQDNVTRKDNSGGPTHLHHRLIQNPSYRMRFADRAYEHLRRGTLTPEMAESIYRTTSDPIEWPIRLESARWGDNQRAQPYDRLDWVEIRDSLFGESQNRSLPTFDYFSRRSEIVLNQFRSRNWIPSIDPPTFSQQGGPLASTSSLTMQSGGGTIFYTLDGTDPMGQQPVVLSRQIKTLVSESATKKAYMPENNTLDGSWFEVGFNDADWPSGQAGAGYENGSGYDDFIAPSLNFSEAVSSQNAETIYMRTHFTLEEVPSFDQLTLEVRYDDGFIAYLNGKEVARSNAPGNRGTPAAWNASASASHNDTQAAVFEAVDITAEGLNVLRPGDNVLAIHGLNVSNSSSDFLIWPRLTASTTLTEEPTGQDQAVFRYENPILLQASARLKARSFDGVQWSPLNQAQFLINAVPATAQNLLLTQIHYHPAAPSGEEMTLGFDQRSDFEFLQIKNVSQKPVDLREVAFTDGITFHFQDDSFLHELPAGAKCVVVADPDAFRFRFGSQETIAGMFQQQTNLSNAGERLQATGSGGNPLWDLTYDDQEPWPTLADGQGYYLSRLSPTLFPDANSSSAWEAVQAATDRTLPPPPSISLLLPDEQTSVAQGQNVNISANIASSQNTPMARLECLIDGVSIGELLGPPYLWNWKPEQSGAHLLQIQGWDVYGQYGVSEEVRLIVIPHTGPSSARIAWVSFHTDETTASNAARAAGMTEAPDALYTRLLTRDGHEVYRIATTSTPDKALLESYDLVIVSRSVASGDYASDAQGMTWHGLETPVMILGGYVTRSNRLGFTQGTTMIDAASPIYLKAKDPSHPVFEGIPLDAEHVMAQLYAEPVTWNGILQRGISINQNPLSGGGKIIATHATHSDNAYGGIVIAEWEPGATISHAAEPILAEKRMLFLTGSREASGFTSETAGLFDLTEEGGHMFLNAVRYLTQTQETTFDSFVAIEKSDQGLWIYYTGTLQSAPSLQGPWSDVVGSQNPHPLGSPMDRMQFFRSVP